MSNRLTATVAEFRFLAEAVVMKTTGQHKVWEVDLGGPEIVELEGSLPSNLDLIGKRPALSLFMIAPARLVRDLDLDDEDDMLRRAEKESGLKLTWNEGAWVTLRGRGYSEPMKSRAVGVRTKIKWVEDPDS